MTTNGAIRMTFGQLAEAEAVLAGLGTVKLPYAAAYRLARLTKAVGVELDYFRKERDDLVRELGTTRAATVDERARGAPDEVPEVTPRSPKWSEFLAKVQQLAAVEVTLDLAPFDPSMVPGLEIAAADLLVLGPLLAAPETIDDAR